MVRLALLGLACVVAGCGPQSEDVARSRPTFVSLNPCTDAILAEVADPDQIIALSHFSHDPAATSMELGEARNWPVTGGTVEEVLALQPDVVVASSFLPPATRNSFERMGMEVVMFGVANSIEESDAQVRQLSELAGHARRGDELAARIDAAVDVRLHKDEAKPSLLLWQSGGIVAGGDSLIASLIERAGFRNHAATRGLGQGAYLPLEQVLADPPDVILTAGGERLLNHPVLHGLSHTKVKTFDPSLLYCGGPTIPRAMEALRKLREEVEA